MPPFIFAEQESLAFEVWVILANIIIFMGVLSNSLLLASVTYAKYKGRHNFDDTKWNKATIFFINVAVVDLSYCIFFFVNCMYAIHVKMNYHTDDWVPSSSQTICKVLVLGRQNLGAISGLSTAAISFNNALPKIRQVQRRDTQNKKYYIRYI